MQTSIDNPEDFYSLMGVSAYLREDVFRDRYDVIWERICAPNYGVRIRDFVSKDVLWESPDDILGSVSFAVWRSACADLTEMQHLDSAFGTAVDDHSRIDGFFNSFNRELFEQAVLPWLAEHNPAEYAIYNNALELIKDFPDFSKCPLSERYRWGALMNALVQIHTNFRGAKHPPSIPSPGPSMLDGAVDIYSLPAVWSDEVVIPSEGISFDAWERKFLQKKSADHKLTTSGDVEVAYVPGMLDPFTLFGSQWYILPDLPHFTPVVSSKPKESTAVCVPLSAPLATLTLPVVWAAPPRSRSLVSPKFNIQDGLDVIRDFLRDYYVTNRDLNAMGHGLRKSMGEGILPGIDDNTSGSAWLKATFQGERNKINSSIPYERKISFSELVDRVMAVVPGNGDRFGCALVMAGRITNSRSQIQPVGIENGEIFILRP